MSSFDDEVTKTRRIVLRLCGAKRLDQWVTVSELKTYAPLSTVRTILRRLAAKHAVERRRMQGKTGHWYYVYRASDRGLKLQEEGGLPSRPPKVPVHREVDLRVRQVGQVFDLERVKWEFRQAVIRVDPFTEGQLRTQCQPSKKRRDRAVQATHSETAFTITVNTGGKCVLTLKDPKWDEALLGWLRTTGLSQTAANNIVAQARNMVGELTRVEIPLIDQSFEEMKVQAEVTTQSGPDFVHTAINYSLGRVGWEMYGTAQWIDNLLGLLVALQHTTVVSELKRNQLIADMMALLEDQRKEREAKEKQPKKDEEKTPDYIV